MASFLFIPGITNLYLYNKMMLLALNQVYYSTYKSNTHKHYNQIIKTKLKLSLEIMYKSNQRTKQSRLGFENGQSVSIKREAQALYSNIRQGV